MDRFQTAVQLYKNQQSRSAGKPAEGRLPDPQALPPPIIYSRTRSLDVPLSVLRQRRVMAAYDKGPFVDAFKILRTQVMRRLRENGWNVLGITSPGDGEGKTLTAVNLAISLGMETAQTVLLVDANLRNPTIHEVFGLEDCPGLADYLLDDTPIENLLVHPGIGRLVLLPGGRTVQNSAELLTSHKMLALVEEFKHRYPSRIVIFDLPPLLQTADVLAFSPYTDALLLVVEEGKTSADDVQRALSLVKDSRPILGTVLNKAGQMAATPASMRKLLGN